MNRVQIKAGSTALFVGPTPATGQHFDGDGALVGNTNLITQIPRVQSFSEAWDLPKENVNQFGNTAAIARITTTAPTPTFDFTYLPTNGINESRLGFPIDGNTSIASGILDATTDSKNYFALFSAEGVDAAADTDRANHYVIGLGNGFISNFELSASVGGLAEASVSVEGSNYVVHATSSGNDIPAINPSNGAEISDWQYVVPLATSGESTMPIAIRQGDITIEGLPGAELLGTKLSSANLQSFSVSVPFAREALERFGNQFPFARPVTTPIDGSVSFDFSASDFSTGTLAALINDCGDATYDFNIKMNPCVGGSNTADQFIILVRGASIDSENGSVDNGSARNGSVSMTVPIGAANDTAKGIFLSGAYTA